MKQLAKYEDAYRLTKEYIEEHKEIIRWFWNYGEEWTRGVCKAINDFGVLSEEEEIVYNRIRLIEENDRIYYQGGSISVKGFTDEEVCGAKKYMAHAYAVQMRDRGLTINGTRGTMDNS